MIVLLGLLLHTASLKFSFSIIENRRHKEIPSFAADYKQSWLYGLSTLFAAFFGVVSRDSWRPFSTVFVLAVLGIPLVYHWKTSQPFGLECRYRSIDPNTAEINKSEEHGNVATKSGDGYEIDLDINVGEQIDEVKLRFDPPPGIEIEFVDEIGSFDKYDYSMDEYTAQGISGGSLVLTVYLIETDDGRANHDRSLEILAAPSDECIESIQLL